MPSDIRLPHLIPSSFPRHFTSTTHLIQLFFISSSLFLLYYSFFSSTSIPVPLDIILSPSLILNKRPTKHLPIHLHPPVDYPPTKISLKQLKGLQRTDETGLLIQRKCGEDNPIMTEWINALSNPSDCQAGLNKDALVQSAIQQCGSWCIWDLRTKKPSGWRLTGANCFEQFTSPHDCDEWLYQKPTIFLPPPSVNLKNLSPNEVLLASTEHTNRIDPNQQEEDDDGHMKFRLQDNGGSDIVEKEEERQPDEEQATDANER